MTQLLKAYRQKWNKLTRRHFIWRVLGYGLALALFTVLMKMLEYRYFVKDLGIEVYLGIIALLFTLVGIWMGIKTVNTGKNKHQKVNEEAIRKLQLSKREYEVLTLINQGLSNQQIADRLFISLATVKTHTSNLFEKLGVKRRTQAIVRAKELQILLQ